MASCIQPVRPGPRRRRERPHRPSTRAGRRRAPPSGAVRCRRMRLIGRPPPGGGAAARSSRARPGCRPASPGSPCATRSSGVPWKTSRPSLISTTSVQAATTSSTRWVETSTQVSTPRSRSSSRKSSRCSGSRPTVGSSSSSTAGSLTMAWAMPARRSMPPDRVFIRASALAAEADPVDGPLHGRRDRRLRHLLEPGHVLDELAHGEPRVEAELLRQVAEPRGAPRRRSAPAVDRLAEQRQPSAGRREHGGQRAHQGGLAGAVRARAGRARRCRGSGRARRRPGAGRRAPAARRRGPPRDGWWGSFRPHSPYALWILSERGSMAGNSRRRSRVAAARTTVRRAHAPVAAGCKNDGQPRGRQAGSTTAAAQAATSPIAARRTPTKAPSAMVAAVKARHGSSATPGSAGAPAEATAASTGTTTTSTAAVRRSSIVSPADRGTGDQLPGRVGAPAPRDRHPGQRRHRGAAATPATATAAGRWSRTAQPSTATVMTSHGSSARPASGAAPAYGRGRSEAGRRRSRGRRPAATRRSAARDVGVGRRRAGHGSRRSPPGAPRPTRR